MKETKLKQYLYEHPHLLDDAFEVSLTEANKWAKDNKLSAMDVIALAKEKHPDISSEKWTAFEKVAKQSEQKSKQDKKGSIVHIRWWQVAVAAIILIVLTFTLVPPARAFAESVIRYIVSIFEGGVDITQEGKSFTHGTPAPESLIPPPPDTINTETDYHAKTYPDVASFIEDTGYHPVVSLSKDLSIKEVEFEWLENAYAELCITYESKNGVLIYIWQIWGNERGGTIFEDENDVLIHTTVLDEREVVGFIDLIDNQCALEVLLDESDLTILYHGDFDYQLILNSLQYME